jgi:glycosyltransferase involved in cell wall biosynthesis
VRIPAKGDPRVLFLCYFYPPLAGGGVHRVLGFTRHLSMLGWSSTVVCAGEGDYWVRDESLREAVPADTEVIRVPGGSALSAWMRGGGAARGRRSGGTFGLLRGLSDWWLLPDSYVGWARRARRVAARRVARGDVQVVLSSSPPESVHLAARDVARSSRLPWVADFRDPWVPLAFRTPPTAWHRARQAAMERRVLEDANLVLTASATHADSVRAALGPKRARVEHLPNGFEPLSTAPIETPAVDADHFRIVFTGTLAQMPDTETLLEAVHDLLARRGEARRRLRVQLVGPFEREYEDRAIALGLTGIVDFMGNRPHRETRALQRAADLLALWKPRGQGFRTMVPGKLYEYLDAGRPVVALLPDDEEAAELARRGGATVLPPGRRDLLAAEIERRYQAWRDGGRAPDARPAWLDEHSRFQLAKRLTALLARACAEQP